MNPGLTTIPRMAETSHRLKLCTVGDHERPPEGGVYLKPDHWCCKGCWAGVQMKIARRLAGASWGKSNVKAVV